MKSRAWLAALLLAACQGDGSDIGPKLPELPPDSAKVLVLDDSGNGVSGARVEVGGAVAATGRSGRAELFAAISGRQRIAVDALAASATSSDRLASLTCTQVMASGDVPAPIHLPDTSRSAELVLSGISVSPLVLDDSAVSGARLEFGAGTLVSADGPGAVRMRIGVLQARHLPGELPTAAVGAVLFGRGYWIDPASAQIAPGATLDVPDDLGLGAGAAVLYRLELASGAWSQVATGATSVGGRIRLAGAITRGGLYAYAAEVPATATVRGRVVDATGAAIGNPLVALDGQRAIGGDDGRFELQAVAATTVDGVPRAAALDLRGSGSWLPVGVTLNTPALANGGIADLGDVLLDTVPVGNVRVLSIERAQPLPYVRLGVGSQTWQTSTVGIGGADATQLLEEVAEGYIGFVAGHPFDSNDLYYGRGNVYVNPGQRWIDLEFFYSRVSWTPGGRNTQALALDLDSGCAVQGANVIRGSTDGDGLVATTNEGGYAIVEREFGGRATMSVRSTLPGSSLVSAFTVDQPYAGQLEMTLRRLARGPVGAFDRHGVITGAITGTITGSEQRLRTTRLLRSDDWVADVLLGAAVQTTVPIQTDPSLPPGGFRVGVAAPAGNVVVADGSTVGGVFTLHGLGMAAGLSVPQAAVTPRDLVVSTPADATFSVAGALAGLDAGFTRSELAFDLAFLQPNALIVDVARGIGGNLGGTGQDLTFTLPALQGPFAGGSWLAAVGAARSTATTADRQQAIFQLGASSAPAVAVLPLPTITAPLDGASIPAANGLQVDFALPPGALYGMLDLRSTGSDELRWEAVVLPTATSFRFWLLPTGVPSPLAPQRTYTLTVSAFGAVGGLRTASPSAYQDTVQFWRAIGIGERGVNQLSSRTITITTL